MKIILNEPGWDDGPALVPNGTAAPLQFIDSSARGASPPANVHRPSENYRLCSILVISSTEPTSADLTRFLSVHGRNRETAHAGRCIGSILEEEKGSRPPRAVAEYKRAYFD